MCLIFEQYLTLSSQTNQGKPQATINTTLNKDDIVNMVWQKILCTEYLPIVTIKFV